MKKLSGHFAAFPRRTQTEYGRLVPPHPSPLPKGEGVIIGARIDHGGARADVWAAGGCAEWGCGERVDPHCALAEHGRDGPDDHRRIDKHRHLVAGRIVRVARIGKRQHNRLRAGIDLISQRLLGLVDRVRAEHQRR